MIQPKSASSKHLNCNCTCRLFLSMCSLVKTSGCLSGNLLFLPNWETAPNIENSVCFHQTHHWVKIVPCVLKKYVVKLPLEVLFSLSHLSSSSPTQHFIVVVTILGRTSPWKGLANQSAKSHWLTGNSTNGSALSPVFIPAPAPRTQDCFGHRNGFGKLRKVHWNGSGLVLKRRR